MNATWRLLHVKDITRIYGGIFILLCDFHYRGLLFSIKHFFIPLVEAMLGAYVEGREIPPSPHPIPELGRK